MQAQTPRKSKYTMACRFLETRLPSSQKGTNSHFPPTQKKFSSSPRSRCRIQVYNGRIHTVPLDNLSLDYFCK